MKINYYTNRGPAIRLHTVNVIEMNDGDLQSIHSFADTPKGNKLAEKLFVKLVKKEEIESHATVVSNRFDMDNYLDDGIFENGSGYSIIISHSV